MKKVTRKTAITIYENNFSHLSDELRKLDLLIRKRAIMLRLENSEYAGVNAGPRLFVSHDEVDLLLQEKVQQHNEVVEINKIQQEIDQLQNEINIKVKASLEKGIYLAFPQLAHIFVLSPFELQVLVICLAPELQRKYDKLFVYLQDDISRKRPSVDLVLNLLCETESERWQAGTLFSAQAPLFHFSLLETIDDPQSPSGCSDLARFLKLNPRILNYLLGNNSIDGRLLNLVKLYRPLPSLQHILVEQTIKSNLNNIVRHHFSQQNSDRQKLVLYFQGPYGVGKRDLALGICGQLNCPLLYLDCELWLIHESEFETLLHLIFRESLLLQSALYLDNVDFLFKAATAKTFIKKLSQAISENGWLTFLAGEQSWHLTEMVEGNCFFDIKLSVPDVPLREIAWEKALQGVKNASENGWSRQLAQQFRLTPGQIRDAVDTARNHLSINDGQLQMTLPDIYTACRKQSNQKLAESALKIEPKYGWDDIVLPAEKLKHLKEICSQVRQRYHVFSEWGFDNKLSHGKGLSVLFTGPPGTGKTMAAEVIAHELQLDLYKIDLSGVVSKYIGETEKNLSKIFHEAETSNAILFFDEADALFGKRTQVSDAHDRYANIETSYLLQKMEEYEGVVILASNLRENMDEAFTRRIRFVVEFPFPDQQNRLKIWQSHFPEQTPVSDTIDYEFLSRQFQITGGSIKNIVLNAAFLAAENGGMVGMEHILRGTKREFEKVGKIWNACFRQA